MEWRWDLRVVLDAWSNRSLEGEAVVGFVGFAGLGSRLMLGKMEFGFCSRDVSAVRCSQGSGLLTLATKIFLGSLLGFVCSLKGSCVPVSGQSSALGEGVLVEAAERSATMVVSISLKEPREAARCDKGLL